MKVSQLKYNPANPRKISPEHLDKLKKSITEFPEMMKLRPIVYDPNTMHILGGNQRLTAIKALGMKEIPDEWAVSASELTDQQKKEFTLKDNIPLGEWDFDLLSAEFGEFDFADMGIDMPEMLSDPTEVTEDGYEAPDDVSVIETDIKRGDIIEIGKHRLMCGDSTDEADVALLMDNNKPDMVFTDPPYGLGGYGGRNKQELKNDDADIDTITQFYNLPIYETVSEVYLWGNAKNLLLNINRVPRDVIVWEKNNFGLGKGYRGQYELCFYYGSFSGSDSDVWKEDKDTKYEHPTQKPISLAARAIKNSNPKLNILDLFLGSGSTMVACHQLNRICYGMEISPQYCQVIIDRMEKLDPTLDINVNGIPYVR